MTTFKALDVHRWPMPRDQAEFETALDGGRLFARMAHGRYWQAWRSGSTHGAGGDAWRVPVRVGLNVYAEARQEVLHAYRIRPKGTRARARLRPVGGP